MRFSKTTTEFLRAIIGGRRNGQTKTAYKRSRRLLFEALEPRIMFSGTPAISSLILRPAFDQQTPALVASATAGTSSTSSSGYTLKTLATVSAGQGSGTYAGLTLGPGGNLYGSTSAGGSNGDGTIFKVSPDGTLTTIATFNRADGAGPQDSLVVDSAGDIYGTTSGGGAYDAPSLSGNGTVFRVSPTGAITTLANFDGGDGVTPNSGVILDGAGNLYGTTILGGSGYYGDGSGGGTVFRLSPDGQLTTLISFNGNNGAHPEGSLAMNSAGALFGTTSGGNGGATVFEISANGSFQTLANLPSSVLGQGGLALDSSGDIIGFAGSEVFKISANGTFSVLAAVSNLDTYGTPLVDSAGNIYGTTGGAGNNATVFRLSPTGLLTTLASFGDVAPGGSLARDSLGNVYGMVWSGGMVNTGTVFEISPPAPHLVLAESEKVQGSAGIFGINLPLTGTPAVEDRIGGPTQLVLTFQNPIKEGSSFAVNLSSGTPGTTSVSGNTLTIDLSGAAQGQTLTVGINDVEDASTGASGNYSLQVGVLYGDVTGNGLVNVADINLVRQASGEAVNATDFRDDLNCNGLINVADINIVRQLSGGSLSTGAQWQTVGPKNIPLNSLAGAGKLQAFAVNSTNPLIMYAGGGVGPGNSGPYADSGAFKTTNGGNSWTPIDAGLTDPMVDVLWVDPVAPNTILAGTWFQGIFRSTNAGESWAPVNTSFNAAQITAFLPVGQTLYAATESGIAASADAGATWTLVYASAAPVRVLASAGGEIFAGLDNGTVLLQTTPGGTWQTTLTDPGRTVWSIAVDPLAAQNVYVVEWNGYQPNDVEVTGNGGASWSPLGYSSATQFLAFDPAGTLYAGADGQLSVSTDLGSSWSNIPNTSWDVRLIYIWPGQAGKIVIGSDQGLYMTANAGSSWTSLNSGISSSLLTGVAVNGSTILTAVQDYSPLASFDGGATWQQFWGSGMPTGEDGIMQFNPGNPDYAYAFTTGGFQVSSDGGHSFTRVSNVPFTFAGGQNMIAVDPSSPSTVYVVAQDGVYESTDWGTSFSKLNWSYSGAVITNPSLVVVSATSSQTIYLGATSGLYVTHDGGATWTKSSFPAGVPQDYPVSLAVDPANANILEVGLANWPANGGVLLSTDGGASFSYDDAGLATQQGSMSPYYAWAIAFNPNSTTGQAFLATANGLYESSSPGGPWVNVGGGVVPMEFTGLQWAGNNLYASTYGEGVVVLPNAGAVLPAADITGVSAQQISGTNNWQIFISGSNFGTQSAFWGDSPDLVIVDPGVVAA